MGNWFKKYNLIVSIFLILFGIMLLVIGVLGVLWPDILLESVVRGATIWGLGFILVVEGVRWGKTFEIEDKKVRKKQIRSEENAQKKDKGTDDAKEIKKKKRWQDPRLVLVCTFIVLLAFFAASESPGLDSTVIIIAVTFSVFVLGDFIREKEDFEELRSINKTLAEIKKILEKKK